MTIALIPARGGSQRIPGKNIKPFLGRPMIHYAIEVARQSGLFERIVVSTDSEEIAQVAREGGAEIPFRRPANLSDHLTPTWEVVQHALAMLGGPQQVARLCCLYATAPFVQERYLREGERWLRETGCGSAFSVTTFAFPIFRALKINEHGHLEMFQPAYRETRSNDLPEAYHDAGQFYWIDSAALLRHRTLYGPDARPVILPRYLVQDIDTPEDWQQAEIQYRVLQQQHLL